MSGASKARRRGRPILIFLLILALLPVGGVMIHTFVPIPMTLLMVQRRLEGEGMSYSWRPIGPLAPRKGHSTAPGAPDVASSCPPDRKAIERILDG